MRLGAGSFGLGVLADTGCIGNRLLAEAVGLCLGRAAQLVDLDAYRPGVGIGLPALRGAATFSTWLAFSADFLAGSTAVRASATELRYSETASGSWLPFFTVGNDSSRISSGEVAMTGPFRYRGRLKVWDY